VIAPVQRGMWPAARRAIIAQLSVRPARVTKIAAPFEMSLNAVSKHLKVLERAGLIRRTRQGREFVIEFEAKPLRNVVGWLHTYERFWNQHLDNLEKVFAQRRKNK
jgi:DNA-binding transcriptional ArsR family regulator